MGFDANTKDINVPIDLLKAAIEDHLFKYGELTDDILLDIMFEITLKYSANFSKISDNILFSEEIDDNKSSLDNNKDLTKTIIEEICKAHIIFKAYYKYSTICNKDRLDTEIDFWEINRIARDEDKKHILGLSRNTLYKRINVYLTQRDSCIVEDEVFVYDKLKTSQKKMIF